jgi:hypothetical protein
MTGKNPEFEVMRFEEISRVKDSLKRAGGEDFSPAGEKFESSHRGEKPVRSPDTINAYRAREPRAESDDSVDTINAYRSTEPCPDSPYWADTEDEELDDGSLSARIRRGV